MLLAVQWKGESSAHIDMCKIHSRPLCCATVNPSLLLTHKWKEGNRLSVTLLEATYPKPSTWVLSHPLISSRLCVFRLFFFLFLIAGSCRYLLISLPCNYTGTQWYSRHRLFVLVKLPLIPSSTQRGWGHLPPHTHTRAHTIFSHWYDWCGVEPPPSGYTYSLIKKTWIKRQRARDPRHECNEFVLTKATSVSAIKL